MWCKCHIKPVLIKFSSQLNQKDQLARLPYIGYFYGESSADTSYSIFSIHKLVDYETGLNDIKLPKTMRVGPKATADIEEDLAKDPKDRQRGASAFEEDFKIPSFGLCHDLIASSTLDSIAATEESNSDEADDDVPDVRPPAKIFRSFRGYHIIKTKIPNGRTGGLILHVSHTPRVMRRALKAVFTCIATEIWSFELGPNDVQHGIDDGDIFVTREDMQWHFGTPPDFQNILQNLDGTVFLLRRSAKQKEKEAESPRQSETDAADRANRTKPLKRSGNRSNKRSRAQNRKSTDVSSAPSKRPKQDHLTPSEDDMKACTTPRAVRALESWYQRYNELVDYRRKHGDCHVPQVYKANPSLGTW